MTRVYAIRTGCYSDTGWGPIFSTPEKALAYRDIYNHRGGGNNENCKIEVHVLDDENDSGPVYPHWLVVFDARGNALKAIQEGDPTPSEDVLAAHQIEVQVPPRENQWYFLDSPIGIREKTALVIRNVRAPDLAHAVKIASERRTGYLIGQTVRADG